MAVSTVNPWAAGAVEFDQRPFMQFYERQMVRQQAKQDALENYFKDLNKNITSTGMRSQDVPTLLQKQQEWQQLGIQRKNELLNPKLDGGRTLMEYQQKYNEMQGLINESKEALKTMDQVGKLRLNPQMSHVADDPHFMEQVKSHDLPIGDPNRAAINLATITLPPKPLDVKDWDAYNKYLTGGVLHDKIPGKTENIGGFKTRTPIMTQYGAQGQLQIAGHAANAYNTDKRFRSEAVKVFNELQNDPVKYDQYNKVYKSLYGTDIDDPKEAWMAKGIIDNNMKATEYKEGKDDFGLQEYMRKMKHADAKELIRLRKEIDPNDTELNNVWYKSYLDRRIEEAQEGGELHDIFTTKGKGINRYRMIKPDPLLMKSFARDGREPDRIGVTDKGEVIPIFFKLKKDESGTTVVETLPSGAPVVDTDYTQPMSYDQALVNLGYRGRTKTQLGKDLSKGISSPKQTNRTYKIDGKSFTRKQLNEEGYDDKEIEEYINLGIIK